MDTAKMGHAEAALKKLKRRACGPCASAKRPCDLQDNDRQPGAPSTCSRCRQIGKADLCIVLPDKRTKQYGALRKSTRDASDDGTYEEHRPRDRPAQREDGEDGVVRAKASRAATGSAVERSGATGAAAALHAAEDGTSHKSRAAGNPAEAWKVKGKASGALHKALSSTDAAQQARLRELLSSDARLDPADEELLQRITGAPVSLALASASEAHGSFTPSGASGRSFAQAMATEQHERDCRTQEIASKSPHPTLLVTYDGGGRIKGGFANDPWLSIFGLTAESVHASLSSGLFPRRVHPMDAGMHEACTMTTLAKQQPYQQHVARFRMRDDRYVSAQETLQVHYGGNGRPLRMTLLYTILDGDGSAAEGAAHSRLHGMAAVMPAYARVGKGTGNVGPGGTGVLAASRSAAGGGPGARLQHGVDGGEHHPSHFQPSQGITLGNLHISSAPGTSYSPESVAAANKDAVRRLNAGAMHGGGGGPPDLPVYLSDIGAQAMLAAQQRVVPSLLAGFTTGGGSSVYAGDESGRGSYSRRTGKKAKSSGSSTAYHASSSEGSDDGTASEYASTQGMYAAPRSTRREGPDGHSSAAELTTAGSGAGVHHAPWASAGYGTGYMGGAPASPGPAHPYSALHSRGMAAAPRLLSSRASSTRGGGGGGTAAGHPPAASSDLGERLEEEAGGASGSYRRQSSGSPRQQQASSLLGGSEAATRRGGGGGGPPAYFTSSSASSVTGGGRGGGASTWRTDNHGMGVGGGSAPRSSPRFGGKSSIDGDMAMELADVGESSGLPPMGFNGPASGAPPPKQWQALDDDDEMFPDSGSGGSGGGL